MSIFAGQDFRHYFALFRLMIQQFLRKLSPSYQVLN